MTPYSVAKFNVLAGYPDVEVFAHSLDDDPFINEGEYEGNIYQYSYETRDVIRVTFEELQRLMKVVIEYEIDRGNISDSEKEEYKKLIKDQDAVMR